MCCEEVHWIFEHTTRTTTRSQSKKPSPYPTECALNRGCHTQDAKVCVEIYNTWKGSDRPTENPISVLGTVTPPGKGYSTGATPVQTPSTPSQQQSERPSSFANGGSVSRLNLSSVEKPAAITARDPSTFGNPATEANTSRNASHKPTSTTPSTIAAMPGWEDIGFTEQHWNALENLMGARNLTPDPAGSQGPQSPPGPVNTSTNGQGANGWNAAEISMN